MMSEMDVERWVGFGKMGKGIPAKDTQSLSFRLQCRAELGTWSIYVKRCVGQRLEQALGAKLKSLDFVFQVGGRLKVFEERTRKLKAAPEYGAPWAEV